MNTPDVFCFGSLRLVFVQCTTTSISHITSQLRSVLRASTKRLAAGFLHPILAFHSVCHTWFVPTLLLLYFLAGVSPAVHLLRLWVVAVAVTELLLQFHRSRRYHFLFSSLLRFFFPALTGVELSMEVCPCEAKSPALCLLSRTPTNSFATSLSSWSSSVRFHVPPTCG